MSFWTRKDRKKNKPTSAPQPQSTYATHSKGCVHEYMRVEFGHNQRLITRLIKWFIIQPLHIFSPDFGKFMEKRTQIQPTNSGLYQQVHYFVNQNATLQPSEL